jgi:hypothetical protein
VKEEKLNMGGDVEPVSVQFAKIIGEDLDGTAPEDIVTSSDGEGIFMLTSRSRSPKY